jgi:hypothetical protein
MNVSSVEVPDQCVTIVHMGSADVAAIPGDRIRQFSTGRQIQECRYKSLLLIEKGPLLAEGV